MGYVAQVQTSISSFGTGTHRNAVPVLFNDRNAVPVLFHAAKRGSWTYYSHKYSNCPENAPKCAFRAPKNENFCASPDLSPRFCSFLHYTFVSGFQYSRLLAWPREIAKRFISPVGLSVYKNYIHSFLVFLSLPRDATQSTVVTECCPSVRPSVSLSVTFIFHTDWNSSQIIPQMISLRFMRGLAPIWTIWSNGNTPKIRVE